MQTSAKRIATRWLEAATFDPPPRLVADIVRWVEAVAASEVDIKLMSALPKLRQELASDSLEDWKRESKERLLVDYIQLRHEVDRILRGVRTAPEYGVRTFSVDLTGWKYLPMLRDRLGTDPQKALRKTPYEYIQVQYTEGVLDGSWSPSKAVMRLKCKIDSPSLQTFRRGLAEFESLVVHETTHVGQDILRVLLDLPSLAGLPPKVLQEPGYNPEGYPRNGPQTMETKEPHALREVEFKTRLRDEITKFVRAAPRIPRDKLHEALRIWTAVRKDSVTYNPAPGRPTFPLNVSPMEFFSTLKDKNPAKWRRAVSEFYAGVAREGIPV